MLGAPGLVDQLRLTAGTHGQRAPLVSDTEAEAELRPAKLADGEVSGDTSGTSKRNSTRWIHWWCWLGPTVIGASPTMVVAARWRCMVAARWFPATARHGEARTSSGELYGTLATRLHKKPARIRVKMTASNVHVMAAARTAQIRRRSG